MSRGDVWWYEAPDQKRRPVCVLTRASAVPILETVLAVPATTVIRTAPAEVALNGSDGMPRECVLNLDNVAPVPKAHLTGRITRLSAPRMQQVCRALRVATGC